MTSLRALLLVSLLVARSGAAQPPPAQRELLLFEDSVVTLAAKKPQSLWESPAAIYVITQEDIRRSGMQSIPELLRMVPGLDVAQITAHTWAVSARGFNGEFANKLLVLVDGRSVYTPLFSGVLWDEQDLLLEDVERIEVIRGPGGALWGANAVNGVINVVTKDAKDTQGALVTAGGGTEERALGGVRFGGALLGGAAHYRVYGKYSLFDDASRPGGAAANDGWHTVRGGFRLDWAASPADSVTMQGDLYHGEIHDTFERATLDPPSAVSSDERTRIAGGDWLGRWIHRWAGGERTSLQLYYDRTERGDLGDFVVDTGDVDLQHEFEWGSRQALVVGGGYRGVADRVTRSFFIAVDPDEHLNNVFNLFVRDDVTVVRDRLHLIVGTRIEHNDVSGFEYQPDVRLLWTASARHTLWAAVSRAVQTPDRTSDLRFNVSAFPGRDGRPSLVALLGEDTGPETLWAYQIGLRSRATEALLFDAAGFYQRYEDLRVFVPAAPFVEGAPPPLHVVIPMRAQNVMRGESRGFELSASWAATTWWKLSASYSWFDLALHSRAPGHAGEEQERASPHHQAQLRSYVDLPYHLEGDAAVYFVDFVRAAGIGRTEPIAGFTRADLRLGWIPSPGREVSIVLQNALDPRHPEFTSALRRSSQAQRALFGKLTWRW